MPVPLHQLVRPWWLNEPAAWQEFAHHRLDVDNGGSMNRVEFCDVEPRTFMTQDLAYRAAQAVRSVLATLRKYPDGWPVRVVTRMPCAADNRLRLDKMKHEQDFNM